MNETIFQDDFSKEIWQSTYKDHSDQDVDDSFRRVAKAVASVENTEAKRLEWEEKFYDLLSGFKGTSGGRIYANAGTDFGGTTMINCFLAPRDSNDIDSLDGILKDVRNQAVTLKSEGGWGQNFSFIRPRGSFIHGIGVESPGAVKYMELYDKTSEIITSGSGKKSTHKTAKGKIRKGAMMGCLDCWHPDIVEFITAKQQPGRLTKFNISVNCIDNFMYKINEVNRLERLLTNDQSELSDIEITDIQDQIKAVDSWDLIFPDTSNPQYDAEWSGDIEDWKSKNYSVKVYQTVSAKWLWNLIMESTYARAEPGVLFLDRANDLNPLNYAEKIVGTNPCLRGDVVISTPNGDVTIADIVQKFEFGQEQTVYTMNTNTNSIETEKITNALLTAHDREILELVFNDGKVLQVTPNHKIFTRNRGYIEAQYLDENDDIMTNS